MDDRIAVIGAGTMGRGIAQVAALAGLRCALCDPLPRALADARAGIARSVEKAIEKGKAPAGARALLAENIAYEERIADAVRGASVVIEAVPEDLALKARVLAEAAAHAPSECILASNTSSLSITALASRVPEPRRVAGMHFFNPVPVMELVEIVRGAETAPEVAEALVALGRRLGKEPILVADAPGFATSRLGVALGLEAIRMLEAKVATAADIDRAMELGYRHPMGPLRLTDLVGLDVRLAIAEHLERELGERFRPPALLRDLVRAGHLGRKSGRGFYEYPRTE